MGRDWPVDSKVLLLSLWDESMAREGSDKGWQRLVWNSGQTLTANIPISTHDRAEKHVKRMEVVLQTIEL
jgi:hypothetical protein